MSELRTCPICGREHEVADDGTIPTWLVTWTGRKAAISSGKHLSDGRHRRLLELRAKYPERANLPGPPEQRKGFISNRTECFIHLRDAVAEYSWIKGILQKRGDWEEQQPYLTLTPGERATWEELFGPGAIWIA